MGIFSKRETPESKAAAAMRNPPSLGDERKRYSIELTEPEVNALYAVIAFAQSACAEVGGRSPALRKWWNHYGPTLTALDQRLLEFDDSQTPVIATTTSPVTSEGPRRDNIKSEA